MDAGSKTVGVSASTKKEEVYASQVLLRTDIVELISTKRQYRRTRRNRLRYRKPRFLNRVSTKKKGWLAPSVNHKIESHIKLVEKIHTFLPIQRGVIEVASFDIQKINTPAIAGKEYQEGAQLYFWNVREYVLFRDGHTCQHCKGRSKDKVLNVHHRESRKIGGDRPDNLTTLCETCHNAYHRGEIELKISKAPGFRDAAFMGIMRWEVYRRLKEKYPQISLTYGYLTKNTRIAAGIEKSHINDAYCIAGNLHARRTKEHYLCAFKRKNNRQIHKAKMLEGGRKKKNQSPYRVKGFRLFDKVDYLGEIGFVFGRRTSGYFDLRKLDGTKIHASASYLKLKLLEPANTLLMERRLAG